MAVERIVILSKYGRNGASSRVRIMQYIPALEDAGFNVEIAPLFDAGYLEELYRGRRSGVTILGCFARRWRQRQALRAYDFVWLEQEALPWVPWLIESTLLPAESLLISDYDDALFHYYDQHRLPVVRWALGRKIDQVMRRSDAVFVGNNYLRRRALLAGASNVLHVPTVVDIQTYRPSPRPSASDSLTIGWIGTPLTWNAYVVPLLPVIEQVLRGSGHRFSAIGAKMGAERVGSISFVPWSEEGEVGAVQEFDVGIMPLIDSPIERGKCGYKLIQYMACGRPVVASPVGVNRDIVEDGVNGFLAETSGDWLRALSALLGDAKLRERMGEEGRRRVEQRYSLQRYAPVVIDKFRSLIHGRKGMAPHRGNCV